MIMTDQQWIKIFFQKMNEIDKKNDLQANQTNAKMVKMEKERKSHILK